MFFMKTLEKIINGVKQVGKKTVAVGAIIAMLYGPIKADTGRLDIDVNINSLNYTNQTFKTGNYPGSSEGLDGNDQIYFPIFIPFSIASKVVSIVDPNELQSDWRPENSLSYRDLELSLHSQSGGPISVNSSNALQFTLDPTSQGWEFGTEPITYWEKDSCDPNYASLIANVRKEILQNSGVVPLEDLNGTYISEDPYLRAGIRYDVYDSDLNEDGKVDFRDYNIFANNWKRTGITDSNRSNPSDPGAWADFNLDGDVDMSDLGCFLMNDMWLYDSTNNKFEW